MLGYEETRRKLKIVLRSNDYCRHIRDFRELGFIYEKNGREKHPHLLYNYKGKTFLFVLAGTGSDKRNGLNMVSVIMRTMLENGVFTGDEE